MARTSKDRHTDAPVYRGARYRVLEPLGVGGTGTVFRAHDLLDDRVVALKVLRPFGGATDDARAVRALGSAEFRLLASHNHPGLVRVYEYGRTRDGLTYFTMELLNAETLLEFAERETTQTPEARLEESPDFASVVQQLHEVLEYIHSRGLLHLDLKPSNILVARDASGRPSVKLIDFGLSGARVEQVDENAEPPKDGQLAGTVEYMAPERFGGRTPDARSDLYSLGCVLFEIFTGAPPYTASTPGEVVRLSLNGAPPNMDGVPTTYRATIEKLLAPDPRDRPPSALKVLAELRAGQLDPSPTFFPAFGAALVGRVQLLKQLESAIADAARGSPRAILLRGATGVGKSRLLREVEVVAQIRGYTAGLDTAANCNRPGELLAKFLRRLELSELADHGDEDRPPESALEDTTSEYREILTHIDAFAENDGDALDAIAREARFDQLVDRLDHRLLCLTRERPAIVCIDDLQDADTLSRRALAALLRRFEVEETEERRHIALVFGCGDDSERETQALREFELLAHGSSAFDILTLGGLSESEVESYLAKVLRFESRPDGVARRLHDETGGNVFYIEEYLRLLILAGRLRRHGHAWEFVDEPFDSSRNLGVPRNVEEAIDRRLARLDPMAQRLLEWLAIVDTPQTVDELTDLAMHDAAQVQTRSDSAARDLLAAVESTVAVLVLEYFLERRGSKYFFTHEAARRVVYESMDPVVLRTRHGLLARRLQGRFEEGRTDLVEKLAHHVFHSDDSDQALPYLMQASERARRSGAFREAGIHIDHAIELARDPAERVEALFLLQDIAGHLGDKERQRATLTELRELTVRIGDRDKVRRAALEEALYLDSLGEKRQALNRLEAAAELVADDDGAEASLLSRSALLKFYLSEFESGFETLERASTLARVATDRALQAECLQLAGLGHYLRADYDRALLEMQRALAMRRELGQKHQVGALESNLGLIHLDHGDLEAAQERFNESLKAFREIGLRRGEAVNLVNLGLTFMEMGRFEKALDAISRSLRLRRQLGDRRGEGADLGNLGEIWIRLGRPERALPSIDRAVTLAREMENRASESANLCRLGKVELERKQQRIALEHLERSLQLAQEARVPAQEVAALLMLGRAHLEGGKVEEAKELAEQALRLAADGNMGLRSIEARVLLSALCRKAKQLAAAERHSEEAVTLCSEQSGPWASAPAVWWERYLTLEDCRKYPPKKARDLPAVSEEDCEEALRKSYVALRQISDDLQDAELRRNFLDGVALNRKINQKHEEVQARMRREARRRERSFHEIASTLHSIHELDPLLDHLLVLAIETTHAEKGLILLKDPAGDFITRAARGMERELVEDASDICRSVITDVARGRGPILATDAGSDERFKERQSIISFRIRTLMCVPMVLRGEIIGAVYVDGRGSQSFDRDDLEYLVSFAQLAAIAVDNARLLEDLRAENRHLRQEVEGRYRFKNLVCESPAMQRVTELLAKVSRTDASILLTGETGTGKEVVARAIHYASTRRARTFVAVDCGALPDSLLESELFGHKKGSFSGALNDRRGLFEEADGGTLFLDEISNTSLDLQAKLLRVLQEGEVRPVGENKTRKADVRILAATNVDLQKAVAAGSFREDLFYRLNVVSIELPPLRERSEDIPLLARHFLEQSCKRLDRQITGFTETGLRFLTAAPWRGNVRELENLIERAVILTDLSELDRPFLESLATPLGSSPTTLESTEKPVVSPAGGATADDPLAKLCDPEGERLSLEEFDGLSRDAERLYLDRLVKASGGNLSEAARQAKVRNRNTLISRLKKHGLFRSRRTRHDAEKEE